MQNNNINRDRVVQTFVFVSLLVGTLFLNSCGQKGSLYLPAKATQIRFYNINDQQQQRELALVPDTNQAGCHNLPVTRAVYRVAQVGFAFCQIYREKNCAPGSEYTLYWSVTAKKEIENTQATTRITEGAMWFFTDIEENLVSSWSCNVDAD